MVPRSTGVAPEPESSGPRCLRPTSMCSTRSPTTDSESIGNPHARVVYWKSKQASCEAFSWRRCRTSHVETYNSIPDGVSSASIFRSLRRIMMR